MAQDYPPAAALTPNDDSGEHLAPAARGAPECIGARNGKYGPSQALDADVSRPGESAIDSTRHARRT
jgi:hypothetical protein